MKQSGEVAYTIPLTAERIARIELAIAKTGESKRSFFRDAVYEHLLLLESLK